MFFYTEILRFQLVFIKEMKIGDDKLKLANLKHFSMHSKILNYIFPSVLSLKNRYKLLSQISLDKKI